MKIDDYFINESYMFVKKQIKKQRKKTQKQNKEVLIYTIIVILGASLITSIALIFHFAFTC
jgi:hypothetical protein